MYESISFDVEFGGCGECVACCDGSRFLLMPLIVEDFAEVYEFFPILFGILDEKIRAFILISDGNSPCPYLSKSGCTIYDRRPPGCRIYPFSPYYNKIVADRECEATKGGEIVARGNIIDSRFYHKRLESFEEKFKKSLSYFAKLDKSLTKSLQIGSFTLYKYSGKELDDYLQMHLESLSKLGSSRV